MRHPKQFWELYEGKELATAKHQTIGENITYLAFERNGGSGYSGTYQGKKYGEAPNNELGAMPEGLHRSERAGSATRHAGVKMRAAEGGREGPAGAPPREDEVELRAQAEGASGGRAGHADDDVVGIAGTKRLGRRNTQQGQ